MKKALVGVNAGALGLIVAAFFVLWIRVPLQYSACAVLGCCLVTFFNVNTPLAIGLSGLLGIFINLISHWLAHTSDATPIAPPIAAIVNSTLALMG
jgi:hypothetical protein